MFYIKIQDCTLKIVPEPTVLDLNNVNINHTFIIEIVIQQVTFFISSRNYVLFFSPITANLFILVIELGIAVHVHILNRGLIL